MANILDLTAYQEETADIRLTDGAVLHLKKPTEKLVIHLLRLRDINEDSEPVLILAALNSITLEILNCNTDGLTFTMEGVSQMATDAKVRICKAYSDWAVELQSNPTTSSRSFPEKATKGTGSLLRRFTPWRNMRA